MERRGHKTIYAKDLVGAIKELLSLFKALSLPQKNDFFSLRTCIYQKK